MTTTTTKQNSWSRVAAGHYKLGYEWAVFQRGREDWVIFRYGEEVLGVGACTLRTAKMRVDTLRKSA